MAEPDKSNTDARASIREVLKDWTSIAQGVAAVGAIIVAGWWFFFQGESRAKVNLETSAYNRKLDSKTTLLAVAVKAHNVGKRPTNLNKGAVRVDLVDPVDAVPTAAQRAKSGSGKDLGVFSWRTLGSMDIPYPMYLAPGEYDTFNFEFLIPSKVAAVRIYADLMDPSRAGQAWAAVTFHDVQQGTTTAPRTREVRSKR